MERVRITRINGLGHVFYPLTVVRVAGQRKLMIAPWAAIGTDVAGLGLATAGFIYAEPLWVKMVCFFGGLWMGMALTTELVKLAGEDEAEARLIYEV